MAASVALRGPRLASPALAALAVAAAAATVLVTRGSTAPLTSYAAASATAHAADLVAGLGLAAAGVAAWGEARTRGVGLLALAAAIAWLAPDWEGWLRGPSLARSVAALITPFIPALVLHVALVAPRGQLATRHARVAVAAGYAATFAFATTRALFRDPVLDVHCWRNCTDNSFLIRADQGLVRSVDSLWLRASLAIGLLAAAIGVYRLVAATAASRRRTWAILAAAVLAGGAQAAYALGLISNPTEDPRSTGFAALFLVRAISLAALAGGIIWAVARARRARSAVTHLARDLGDAPAPGELREALAAALGDDALEVVYPLGDAIRFVDGHGRPAAKSIAASGRAVTPVVRGRQPVAFVAHDAALFDAPTLERELGAAARLAFENERLQAEVLAQLDDLRASRSRIVERGDAERRRLERDLHDGAQQGLLALSYDLRLALADAESEGDATLAEALERAVAEVHHALAELRELAQGIYPNVLAEAGLGAALDSLCDTSRLPLDLAEAISGRLAPAVEVTAYVVALEAIEDAAMRGATRVTVGTRREHDRFVIEARDDGAPRSGGLVHLADRVGALGGSLEVGGREVRAEVPCGS